MPAHQFYLGSAVAPVVCFQEPCGSFICQQPVEEEEGRTLRSGAGGLETANTNALDA